MSRNQHFGLLAHPVVRRFLQREPHVEDGIKGFILGQTPAMLDVAGPPDSEEALAYKRRSGHLAGIPLPSVRLHLSMVRNLTTGEDGVEVKVSDDHLAELEKWERQLVLSRQTGAEIDVRRQG